MSDSAPIPAPADLQEGGTTGSEARLRRVVLASLVGNILEWFDFAIYGYFAVAIGRHFFPSDNPTVSLLAALGVFAAGFIARPVGGAIFGHIADRMGRRKALLASVALMAVPTFLMGVLPTYAQIGAAAPVLLLSLRLLQGLSVGGEYATSVVYSVEHAPPQRRGLIASFSNVGAIGGMLLGSGLGALISALLPPESVDAWGWRIPFLFGILLGGFGLLLRRGLVEGEPAKEASSAHGTPLLAAMLTHKRQLLQVIGVSCLNGVGFYILFVYSVTYMTTVLHEDMREAFDANTLALALLLVAAPIGAALSDRFGRKPVLGGFAAVMMLAAWPLFEMLHSNHAAVVLAAQCGFALVMGPFLGTIPAVMVEAFPRSVRCTAAALAYNLSMAVFGGLSPAFATWLIGRTGQDLMPAFLVIGAAVISLVTVLTMRETARQPLH